MGQVSEINDDWCTGYTTISLPLAAANPSDGTWSFPTVWAAGGTSASLVIPLDGSIPVGAIITSILCKVFRADATDVSVFSYISSGILASKSITTGNAVTTDLLVSPTTGHGPLQFSGIISIGGFSRPVSFILFESHHANFVELQAIQVTYYLPPPGW